MVLCVFKPKGTHFASWVSGCGQQEISGAVFHLDESYKDLNQGKKQPHLELKDATGSQMCSRGNPGFWNIAQLVGFSYPIIFVLDGLRFLLTFNFYCFTSHFKEISDCDNLLGVYRPTWMICPVLNDCASFGELCL